MRGRRRRQDRGRPRRQDLRPGPSTGNKVLDPGTGALLRSFPATAAPAFSGSVGLYLNSGTLQAVSGTKTLWTFIGNGHLNTAPIVAGSTVYIGSQTGTVYGLSVTTGKVTWSANAGAEISESDEQNVSAPMAWLGAGQGLLVVPAGNRLVAYSR